MKRISITIMTLFSILSYTQDKTSNKNPVVILSDHSSWIFAIAVSKDGKYFASASRDKTIKIYNSKTKTLIKTLTGHKKDVNTICFSPDSRYLVSGSDDSNVLIWNIQKARIINTLKGHKGVVYSVKFSPNGKLVVSGGADGKVILWNTKTGKKIKVFKGHRSYVRAVCFSRDGKLVASAGNDRLIRIWSVEKKKLIKVINGVLVKKENNQYEINKKYIINFRHVDAITSICFGPENKYVVTSSFDKTIRIFSLNNRGFQGYNRVLSAHKDKVYSISFSNNGKYMVSAGKDKTINIWNTNTFKPIAKYKAHNSWIFTAVFSKDDKYILSGGKEQIVKAWDLNNILKLCKVPAFKHSLVKGKLDSAESHYFDKHYYIKLSHLKGQYDPQGYIYTIFNRKTKSFLMRITIDFNNFLCNGCQRCMGREISGITVFPNLKYMFTSTGQNPAFLINLESLSIKPLNSNRTSYHIDKITKDLKYCIVDISEGAGELCPNIGSVAIYNISSGFDQIYSFGGQFFGYEYCFIKMSRDEKRIVILKKPHSSASSAPAESRINTEYAYRQTYSFPDLTLISSKKIRNPY